MPFLAALAPLIGIGTAAGGATTAASVLGALGTLGGLAGAGVGIGETVAGGGAPSPTAPTTPTPTPPDQNALANLKKMIGSADANTQASTGGAAGDDFRRFIDQFQAGTTGQPGSAGAAAQVTGQSFTPANSQPVNAAVAGQPNLFDVNSIFG